MARPTDPGPPPVPLSEADFPALFRVLSELRREGDSREWARTRRRTAAQLDAAVAQQPALADDARDVAAALAAFDALLVKLYRKSTWKE